MPGLTLIIMSIILNKEILSELNQCRSNPRRYSSKLVSLLQFYKGSTLIRPDREPIETKEGIKNAESCIKYLKTVRPSPLLKWSNSLMDVAKMHAQDLAEHGISGHFGSDDAGLEERIKRVCVVNGHVGENIDYGNSKPEDIVCSLLIDDGMYARGQRLNIMKKDHKYVGAAVCAHKEFQFVCVMIFAESVHEDFEGETSSDLTLNLEEVKDLRVPGDYSLSLQESNQLFDNQSLFLDDLGVIIEDSEKIGQSSALASKKIDEKVNEESEESEKPEKIDEKDEIELSESSAFNNPEPTENSSVTFSVSKTEIVLESTKKSYPTTKPPLIPKPKDQKDEFIVSNFERSELSKDAIVEIKELFDIYDTSGSGFLDSHALKAMKDQLSEGSNSDLIQVLCNAENDGAPLNFNNFLDLVSEKLGLSNSKHITLSLSRNTKNQFSIRGKPKFDPTLYMRPEFTKADILEIKAAFDMFDIDNTGTINPSDLIKVLKSQGYEQKNSTVFRLVNNLQVDNTENVNFGEFLDLIASENADVNSEEEIRKLFNIFDPENTGFIELSTLKKIAKELGDALDEQEIIELFTKSDRDKDGKVSFQDFFHTMSKKLF